MKDTEIGNCFPIIFNGNRLFDGGFSFFRLTLTFENDCHQLYWAPLKFLRSGSIAQPFVKKLLIKDNGKFKYHQGWKELKISHLCFADDLLVLSHGDVNSVKEIKDAMYNFSAISSLHPNIGKNTVFLGNFQEHIKQQILDILPFMIGTLPVSYLGVPLITKQLTFADCKCLIGKVKARVSNWKNKMLSYAGRLC